MTKYRHQDYHPPNLMGISLISMDRAMFWPAPFNIYLFFKISFSLLNTMTKFYESKIK